MEIRGMEQTAREHMKIALHYSSMIIHNLAYGNKD